MAGWYNGLTDEVGASFSLQTLFSTDLSTDVEAEKSSVFTTNEKIYRSTNTRMSKEK